MEGREEEGRTKLFSVFSLLFAIIIFFGGEEENRWFRLLLAQHQKVRRREWREKKSLELLDNGKRGVLRGRNGLWCKMNIDSLEEREGERHARPNDEIIWNATSPPVRSMREREIGTMRRGSVLCDGLGMAQRGG